MSKGTTTMIRLTPWLLLAGLTLAAIPGMADNISDTLTVFNPAGKPVYVLSSTPQNASDGQNLFYIANPSLSNVAMIGNYTLVCDTANCSDPKNDVLLGVFQVTNAGHSQDYLGFMLAPINGAPSGYTVQIASGVPISATQYLSPTLQAAGWTATFVADAPGATASEPSALVLLGSGILGITGFVRRRMRL